MAPEATTVLSKVEAEVGCVQHSLRSQVAETVVR